MLKTSRLLPLAAATLTLGGCGGSAHHPSPPPTRTAPLGAQIAKPTQLAAQCPVGRATMGCAIARNGLRALPPLTLAGPKIPDVSSYQGCPNWQTVKAAGAVGGIAKAGESSRDPSLSCNARGLQAAHLWHSYYWFVRGAPCTGQAIRFATYVRAVDPTDHVLILDAEVPAARGQVPCMASVLHGYGYIVVVYTAPGTWPGGGNAGAPLWVATYGSHPSFANLWTSSPLAWQFSGDCFGPAPHSWPGIPGGCIDMSLDYGITRLGVTPARTWLQRGDRGGRVWVFLHNLTVAHWFARHGDYYSSHVAGVVAAFQRHHHLRPLTGVAGARTQTAAHAAAVYARHHPRDRRPA